MTDEEIPFGGYETTVTPFKPGAAQNLIEHVMSHLEGPLRAP